VEGITLKSRKEGGERGPGGRQLGTSTGEPLWKNENDRFDGQKKKTWGGKKNQIWQAAGEMGRKQGKRLTRQL